jgi:endonuclease YncB( thermonuclease family)
MIHAQRFPNVHNSPVVLNTGFHRPHRPTAIRYVLLILSLFCACSVAAETLIGRVVGVADGDTITVLDDANRQHRIRLAGIDAPEKSQPFGRQAKEHLAGLVFGRPVIVEWHKHDRYGRIVGVCTVEGRDVGLDQLETGLAWHYKKYAHEQADDERREYEKAETKARNEKRGLWQDPDPIPPWEWRKML